ncbi:uncharacterized protein V1510DRAFT_422393 [Dipodascopsis tothii]|uniref:uncharacterized protein n=1 Tax=Dipodascopsis tothii TaxID=44089 RepID=UPI0034CE1D06
MRLRLAYYKLRTNQTTTPLSELPDPATVPTHSAFASAYSDSYFAAVTGAQAGPARADAFKVAKHKHRTGHSRRSTIAGTRPAHRSKSEGSRPRPSLPAIPKRIAVPTPARTVPSTDPAGAGTTPAKDARGLVTPARAPLSSDGKSGEQRNGDSAASSSGLFSSPLKKFPSSAVKGTPGQIGAARSLLELGCL